MTGVTTPTINVRERLSKEVLALECTFRNLTGHSLFVFTRAMDRGYKPCPQPYAMMCDSDRTLHLSLAMPPLPPGHEVYGKVIPFASHVETGASVSFRVEAALPIREWHPYAPIEYPKRCVDVFTDRVLFSTDYFLEKDQFSAKRYEENPELWLANGYPLQRIETSLRLARPVLVLKRTDDFLRF
jgi:hypothetical protein